MQRRRVTGALAALAAAALFLAGCAGGGTNAPGESEAGDPKYGGNLVVGLYLEPLALDPHRQGFWETYRVSRNIFEGLTKEDTSGNSDPTEVLPSLATEWESENESKTWTFKLREDVTFSDGSPFNAEAVDKNVRRISDPDYEFFDEAGRHR